MCQRLRDERKRDSIASPMEREPFNPNLIRVPPAEQPQRRGPLTVSQVTTLVKQAIKSELPATIHVVSEISNLTKRRKHLPLHVLEVTRHWHPPLSSSCLQGLRPRSLIYVGLSRSG